MKYVTFHAKVCHLQRSTLGLLHRRSRRRLDSPWVGPINAALKRPKLPAVTPGAASTLSTSLFLCRFSGAFPLPSPTRPETCAAPFAYCSIPGPRAKCGGAPVPRDAKAPDDPLLRSPSIIYPFPPAHVIPRSAALPTQPYFFSFPFPIPKIPGFINVIVVIFHCRSLPWEPRPSVHAEQRPRPQHTPRAHRCVETLTSDPLEGVFVGEDAVVRRLAPDSENLKQHDHDHPVIV